MSRGLVRRAPALALLALCACGPDREPTAAPVLRALAAPVAPGSAEPHLAVGANDQLVMSWLEPDGSDYVLKYAQLDAGAAQWGPAVTVARGDNFVVNAADFPSVEPITRDLWAAHWLVSSPTSLFAYDIVIATSADGGRTWGEPRLLNDDGTEAEHGFVSLFAWGADIGAVWLDGRELAALNELAPEDAEVSTAVVGTNLRFARIASNGSVLEQGLVDELACDCCQTEVAQTSRGPVVVYRDRSPEEIRDIVVRTHQGSLGWSEASTLGPDNWQIEGCPVNGPAIAADRDEVAVAWFTAPADQPRVRVARSDDAGANFRAPVDVDKEGAFGYVDVALGNDGETIVSWWRRGASGGTELSARRIDAAGGLGEIQTIATSMASRPLDVPQMVRAGDLLVFAWTEFDGDESTVRTATVTL